MIVRMHFGDPKLSTPVDNNQSILLEETNVINGFKSYTQTTVGGLMKVINNLKSEVSGLRDELKECGYVECNKCGQLIHKDDAVWIKSESIHICEDCKE